MQHTRPASPPHPHPAHAPDENMQRVTLSWDVTPPSRCTAQPPPPGGSSITPRLSRVPGGRAARGWDGARQGEGCTEDAGGPGAPPPPPHTQHTPRARPSARPAHASRTPQRTLSTPSARPAHAQHTPSALAPRCGRRWYRPRLARPRCPCATCRLARARACARARVCVRVCVQVGSAGCVPERVHACAGGVHDCAGGGPPPPPKKKTPTPTHPHLRPPPARRGCPNAAEKMRPASAWRRAGFPAHRASQRTCASRRSGARVWGSMQGAPSMHRSAPREPQG